MQIEIIVAYIAATVSITTLIVSALQYFHTKEIEERKEKKIIISQRLNEFYGPVTAYLNLSTSLYVIFKSNKPKKFRLIPFLLDPNQEYDGGIKVELNNADDKLILEIIDVCKKIEDLILLKSGLIDDEILTHNYIGNEKYLFPDEEVEKLGLLSILLMNFRVLRMVFDGKLNENNYDKEKLNRFIFPDKIHDELARKIKSLQSELNN